MAEDELEIVRLRNDFCRDGFDKVLLALLMTLIAIGLLCAISVFLYLKKPAPVLFPTDKEWRIVPPAPLDQPYLNSADLLQWVSEALPKLLTMDFFNYKKELDDMAVYFTPAGWKKYMDQVSVYANDKIVVDSRSFLNAEPTGAPIVINQGLLPEGSYGWWVQMPLNIHSSSLDKNYDTLVVVKALVVRVSTLSNLSGVAIADILVSKAEGGVSSTNG